MFRVVWMQKQEKIGFIEQKLLTILKQDNGLTQMINNLNGQNKDNVLSDIIDSLQDPKAKAANRFSLIRIPLALIIPATAFTLQNQWLTLGLVSLYAISDYLDGFWSKKVKKHPTKGGAVLDASCDKIGAIALIIPALFQNPLLLINGVLECLIAKINTKAITDGSKPKSTKLGKLKMWPLSAALYSTYMSVSGFMTPNVTFNPELFLLASNILIPITAILEIANIKQYAKMAKTINFSTQKANPKSYEWQTKTILRYNLKKTKEKSYINTKKNISSRQTTKKELIKLKADILENYNFPSNPKILVLKSSRKNPQSK